MSKFILQMDALNICVTELGASGLIDRTNSDFSNPVNRNVRPAIYIISRARRQALGYYIDFAQRLAYFGYERVHSHDQSIKPFELLFEPHSEQTSSRPKSTSSSIRKL